MKSASSQLSLKRHVITKEVQNQRHTKQDVLTMKAFFEPTHLGYYKGGFRKSEGLNLNIAIQVSLEDVNWKCLIEIRSSRLFNSCDTQDLLLVLVFSDVRIQVFLSICLLFLYCSIPIVMLQCGFSVLSIKQLDTKEFLIKTQTKKNNNKTFCDNYNCFKS